MIENAFQSDLAQRCLVRILISFLITRRKNCQEYIFSSLSFFRSRREILGRRKKFNRCLVLGQSSLLKKRERERGGERKKKSIKRMHCCLLRLYITLPYVPWWFKTIHRGSKYLRSCNKRYLRPPGEKHGAIFRCKSMKNRPNSCCIRPRLMGIISYSFYRLSVHCPDQSGMLKISIKKRIYTYPNLTNQLACFLLNPTISTDLDN